jgi:protein SCO1
VPNLQLKIYRPIILATILILIGLYSVIQLWDHYSKPPYPKDLQGILLPEPVPLLNFKLEDHHGQLFTQERLQDKWTFLFFGYTHCPDVCPTSLNMLAEMVERLKVNPQVVEETQVLFVSVDPVRDTAPVLKEYVPYFNESFLGVRGSEEQLKILSKNLRASYHITGWEDEENYDISHTSAFFLFDPQGRFSALFQSQYHSPEKMASAYLRIRELQ